MNEATDVSLASGIKQDLCADDIRVQKLTSGGNAPVNMTLRSEIDYGVACARQRVQHSASIRNVTMNETMSSAVKSCQVVQITRVGEGIVINYFSVGPFIENEFHECRTNKTRATCYKKSRHRCGLLYTIRLKTVLFHWSLPKILPLPSAKNFARS